jgi:hypothetical protein
VRRTIASRAGSWLSSLSASLISRCHAAAWKGLMHLRCKLISVASWSGKGDPDMMKALGTWSPAPYLDVTAVDREESRWLVTISGQERV